VDLRIEFVCSAPASVQEDDRERAEFEYRENRAVIVAPAKVSNDHLQ